MTLEVLAFSNLAINSLLGWACVCRLNISHSGVLASVRIKYTLLFTGATANGMQPWLFDQWPGEPQVFFSFVVLLSVLVGTKRWRKGPPADTLKTNAC